MRKSGILVLALLAWTNACSAPRSMVVLLPDADGKVGQIEVRAGSETRVISQAYQTTRLDGAAGPGSLDPAEVEHLFGSALSAHPESAFRFATSRLLCRYDSADITDESRAQLAGLVRSIRSLDPIEIYLVGHSDTVGTDSYNLELSRRRAAAAKALFAGAGVRCPMILVAYGKSRPLPGAGGDDALNRRVEIVVKYPAPFKHG